MSLGFETLGDVLKKTSDAISHELHDRDDLKNIDVGSLTERHQH